MAEQPSTGDPYVFLSYTSGDRARVLALADRLEAAGIGVWVDRRNLVGGSSWDAAIVRAIKDCTVFAVLCSPVSIASANVIQELRLAWDERRPTLPVLLAAVTFPDEMRYILTGRQWVELLDRPEDAWFADLCRALAGLGLRGGGGQRAVGSREEPGDDLPDAAATEATQPPPTADSLLPTAQTTNLPTPLTSFIGREQELAEVTDLLGTERLLTLTGPGGTGKTRLAIATVRQVVDRFSEGVWFVDLAGIVDAAGVLPAIAQVLGVQEGEGRSLAVSLAAYLRRKQLLLVLDNFEQVIEAAMTVYDLLAEAPGLALLVTSRVLLRVAGEQEYAVPPLPLPGESAADLRLLRQSPAVQLFLDRARALRPDLSRSLTDETAQAIGAICRRLDGLPLAIELAAARVKLLPPVQLLARLERRLPLLSGGVRSLPARQQTLRATIAWSWDLLSVPEQILFRRLAVFAAGWTLEAAEAVCNPDGAVDVLEGLGSLVDQSLVRQQDEPNGEPRFRMLATLQEFALEQLEASGETTALRLRHAEYYCTLAEAMHAAFWTRGRYAAVVPLTHERDNLLAALHWLLDAGEGELGLRLAAALQLCWYFRELGEGLRWLETFLAQASGDVSPELRGKGHTAVSILANALGESGVALDHAEQASALLRGTTAQTDLALALCSVALYQMASDAPHARVALEEALSLARTMGAEHLMGVVAFMTSLALRFAQLPAEALPYAEDALRIGRRLEVEWLTAVSLVTLAQLAQLRGDLQAALGYAAESLPLYQMMRDRYGVAHSLAGLAFCRAARGEGDALQTWQASLTVFVDLGHRNGTVTAVLGIAALLAARGQAVEAARLLRAVEGSVEDGYASELGGWAQPVRGQALALAQAALSAEAFAQAWAEGRALSLDQVVALALAATAELSVTAAADPAEEQP